MASSGYYYGLMTEYSHKKRGLQEKLEKYESYLEKLQELAPELLDLTESLSSASNTFLGGGYVVDGQSFDQGKLADLSDKVLKDYSTLATVINGTMVKIESFKTDITNYSNLYDNAHSNYINALEQERKVA